MCFPVNEFLVFLLTSFFPYFACPSCSISELTAVSFILVAAPGNEQALTGNSPWALFQEPTHSGDGCLPPEA